MRAFLAEAQTCATNRLKKPWHQYCWCLEKTKYFIRWQNDGNFCRHGACLHKYFDLLVDCWIFWPEMCLWMRLFLAENSTSCWLTPNCYSPFFLFGGNIFWFFFLLFLTRSHLMIRYTVASSKWMGWLGTIFKILKCSINFHFVLLYIAVSFYCIFRLCTILSKLKQSVVRQ